VNQDLAEALITECEGCKLTAYKDSRGLWTIGVGHLLPQGQDWTGHTIPQEQADLMLADDMQTARVLASEFPHYDELNEVRQAVLISMAFQLGSKPLHWPHFMAALEARDYNAAADAGLDSLWAKQTPARAAREMVMLRTAEWAMNA
jgi:lysozyme